MVWNYFVGDEDALRLETNFQLLVWNHKLERNELVHERLYCRWGRGNTLKIYCSIGFRIFEHHGYPKNVQLSIQHEPTGIQILQFVGHQGADDGNAWKVHPAFEHPDSTGKSEFDLSWIKGSLAVHMNETTVNLRWESIEKLKLFTDHIKVAYPL